VSHAELLISAFLCARAAAGLKHAACLSALSSLSCIPTLARPIPQAQRSVYLRTSLLTAVSGRAPAPQPLAQARW
jgi:hypothetical protein